MREGYEYVRTDYQAGAVQFHLAVQAELFVGPACQSAHVMHKGGWLSGKLLRKPPTRWPFFC